MRPRLRGVLRHPAITMMALAATISVTVYLYVIIPKGFFPEQDTGRLSGTCWPTRRSRSRRWSPRSHT